MEVSLISAAGDAFVTLMDPFRLLMLGTGVLMGLFLGIVPGIGGLVGMALLLPFTFTMDSYSAFAMLLGMSAVTGTSDTIPAVLFGVPGTAGAQATVMDGHPMAKNGEAGRALSAAFSASLIGGLVGALLLAVSIPVLRPVMLYIGSPELLGFSIFGIAMVSVLSGTAPLRGLTAAGVGILLSMIGADPQTGTLRYTMGSFYLWDGLPIVPLVLGVFALPELADLAINRKAITSESKHNVREGMGQGLRDTRKNWWLALRGGGLGAAVGAIPGLGSSVVDWIAYGWAFQSLKGAAKTFGKGDVRGVIAPEAANNAITAGALVPTIAFGVPGSASMAILLSVFLIHGLVPGPDMLTTNLSVTYTMIWSIALANILGASICLAFSGYLAKIALLRYSLILPAVLIFVYIGAFQSSRNWGDLYALLIFSILGWTMKQLRWPRPPLVLGFVLGSLIERYMFISTARYGVEWLTRPLVIILLLAGLLLLLLPLMKHIKRLGGLRGIAATIGRPKLLPHDGLYIVLLSLIGVMVFVSTGWSWGAKVGPFVIGSAALAFCAASFLNQIFSRAMIETAAAHGAVTEEIHMDTTADHGDLGLHTILTRAGRFFLYLLSFMGLMAVIGVLPTVPIFVVAFMRIEAREKWTIIFSHVVVLTLIVYVIFDQLLHIPWPNTFFGQWFPQLSFIPTL